MVRAAQGEAAPGRRPALRRSRPSSANSLRAVADPGAARLSGIACARACQRRWGAGSDDDPARRQNWWRERDEVNTLPARSRSLWRLPAAARAAATSPRRRPTRMRRSPQIRGAQQRRLDADRNADAEGGYLMGNPNAPVKLVEYASLTCPHCRDFSDAASASAARHLCPLRPGELGVPPLPPNAPDVPLLDARPLPAGGGLLRHDRADLRAADRVPLGDRRRRSASFAPLPPEQQIPPLARAMDLDAFFARRGMPAARFNQCLANRQAVQPLTDMTNRAARGRADHAARRPSSSTARSRRSAMAALEPLLRTALGG